MVSVHQLFSDELPDEDLALGSVLEKRRRLLQRRQRRSLLGTRIPRPNLGFSEDLDVAPHILEDLKRARWLPPFNDKVVKEVVNEIMSDHKEMQHMLAEDTFFFQNLADLIQLGLYYLDDLIHRNVRCLLAYLNARLEIVEQLRWEVGRMVPDEKLDKLHEAERQYFNRYNDILDIRQHVDLILYTGPVLDKFMKRYVHNCSHPLNLTAYAEAPEDVNIQVRVLRDDPQLDGIVSNESGLLRLRGGCQMLVKKSDVELLLRAGKVEQVDTCRADVATVEQASIQRAKASRRLRAALLRNGVVPRSSTRSPTRWGSPPPCETSEASVPAVFPFPEPVPQEIPQKRCRSTHSRAASSLSARTSSTPGEERHGSPIPSAPSAPTSRPSSRNSHVPAVFPFPEPIPHEVPRRLRRGTPSLAAETERTALGKASPEPDEAPSALVKLPKVVASSGQVAAGRRVPVVPLPHAQEVSALALDKPRRVAATCGQAAAGGPRRARARAQQEAQASPKHFALQRLTGHIATATLRLLAATDKSPHHNIVLREIAKKLHCRRLVETPTSALPRVLAAIVMVNTSRSAVLARHPFRSRTADLQAAVSLPLAPPAAAPPTFALRVSPSPAGHKRS
eukprot:s2417_g2.t1